MPYQLDDNQTFDSWPAYQAALLESRRDFLVEDRWDAQCLQEWTDRWKQLGVSVGNILYTVPLPSDHPDRTASFTMSDDGLCLRTWLTTHHLMQRFTYLLPRWEAKRFGLAIVRPDPAEEAVQITVTRTCEPCADVLHLATEFEKWARLQMRCIYMDLSSEYYDLVEDDRVWSNLVACDEVPAAYMEQARREGFRPEDIH